MPLYTFRCEPCTLDVQLILDPAEVKIERTCRECGLNMKRTPKGMSARVVETIDPGHYARRVVVVKK